MTKVSRFAATGYLVLACCAFMQQALSAQPARRDSVQRRAVVYRAGDVEIAATLLSPFPGPARRVPAVVIVHGSGSSTRDNPWTTAYAEALAQRGIVVLYPDKRGSGRSSGDWRTSSVQDLAADVKAGVGFLRRQPDVDSAGIGIIGFSQGGYIASVVASEDTAVSFTAVISGGTATLRDQIVDELVIEAERRNQPLTDTAQQRLREVYGSLFAAVGGLRGWAAYARAAARAKEEGGPLAYALRTVPLDSTHWVVGYLASMGDFDPMPYWNRVASPVLFVFGGADTQVRIDASIARLRASPARDHFSIITLGDNGHALFRDDVTAFLAEWFRMRATDR
ncbi:MAG: alpha/beta hydrolase family protein [Gemmatimonadaceae bacterium]